MADNLFDPVDQFDLIGLALLIERIQSLKVEYSIFDLNIAVCVTFEERIGERLTILRDQLCIIASINQPYFMAFLNADVLHTAIHDNDLGVLWQIFDLPFPEDISVFILTNIAVFREKAFFKLFFCRLDISHLGFNYRLGSINAVVPD